MNEPTFQGRDMLLLVSFFRKVLYPSLHPFFRIVLRSYGLAPTQLIPNAWAELVGTYFS